MIAAVCEHVWQSTLFAGAAWVLTLMLRDHRASVRHWVWLTASVKFLLPFSLLTWLGANIELDSAYGARDALAGAITIFAPFSTFIAGEALGQPHALTALNALVYCWVSGVLVLTLRWLRAWLETRSVLRSATRIDIEAPVPVMVTHTTLPPGVFGVLRPAMLLPRGLAERLSPDQLRAIVAHELCHIERRDNLKAAVHRMVETVFWFHPLVWWIGARLIDERERACDEAVLYAGHEPTCYAESVLSVCRWFHSRPLLGVGASGGDLKQRIDGILSARFPLELTYSQRLLLGAVAVLTIATPIAAAAMSPHQRHDIYARSETLVLAPENSADAVHRVHVVTGTLRELIALAYGVPASQIRGDAGWLASRTYRLEVAASVDPSAYRELLTRLLGDRFNLEIYLNRHCQHPCGRSEQKDERMADPAVLWPQQTQPTRVTF